MLDFDKQYIPLDNWINDFIDWLVAGYRWSFKASSGRGVYVNRH